MGRIYVKTNAVVSVSYPGFPEPETRFFWLFFTSPNPGFFQLPNPGTTTKPG